MRRTSVIVIAAIAVVSLVPVVAGASSAGVASSQPNAQYSLWRTAPTSTANRSFGPLTGLGVRICAAGAVSATVSIYGAGGPMQFEVLVDDGGAMAPGRVTFTPVGAGTVAAFTFISNAQPFEANDHHVYQVEWRSATGQRSTALSATLNLIYQHGTHAC